MGEDSNWGESTRKLNPLSHGRNCCPRNYRADGEPFSARGASSSGVIPHDVHLSQIDLVQRMGRLLAASVHHREDFQDR